MKLQKLFFIIAGLLAAAVPARAGLTAAGAAVLDGSGAHRTAFTNLESIALRQVVNNSASSTDRITFKFTIYNPSGGAVFHHEGNSTSGVPGNSNSQLAGIAISMFYSVPGVYKFRGEAQLGTDPAVVQEAEFTVSSPNINLVYPPNGARGLTDRPLIFRWVASGASSYRVTVEDRRGMTHAGTAAGSSYSYPDQPPEGETLVAGTVYYWKVEGLDASGLKIAESSVYTFSLKAQGSSSRNVAVTALELTDDKIDLSKRDPLHFKVTVENTGDTLMAGITLKMTLSGVAAQNSPAQLGAINAGGRWEATAPFTAFMPEGQTEGLAVACVDVFDDNVQDNCKTKLISQGQGEAAVPAGGEKRTLSYQEIWEEVLRKLGPDAAKALEGYTFDTIECPSCSEGELNDLMLSLAEGQAKLSGASVVETSPEGAQRTTLAAPEEAKAQPEEDPDLLVDLMPKDRRTEDEWSGFTKPVSDERPAYYVARTAKEWKRLWKQVSTEDVPEADFGDKMVVGIIPGANDRADTVRLLAKRRTTDGIVYDYYITESVAKTHFVPYIFKLVDREEGAVDFRRLDVGGKK